MSLLHKPLNHFRRDEGGSVAILFGLSCICLTLIAGLAIDSARFHNISSKVQDSLDAATLAGAKMLADDNNSDNDVKAAAQKYFDSSMNTAGITLTSVQPLDVAIDRTNSAVTATVNATVPSFFGGLAFQPKYAVLTQNSKVVYDMKHIELALVLDVTGSMCDTPPAATDPPCNSGAKLNALKSAAKDMVDALFESNPEVGFVKVSLVPYSASVNAGGFAATVSGGASGDGCVVERSGASAYTNATVGSGGTLGTSDTATAPFYSCPPAAVRPLTDLSNGNSRSSFKNAIDNLSAIGGTAGHVGAAWGWYTLSPEWNTLWGSGAARPYDPDKTLKVVVLMTDGEFNVSYANGGQSVPWPDPGASDPSIVGSSGYQALQLCSGMTNPGDSDKKIIVYTVGFQTPLAAEAMLKQCSGTDNYYDANTASQLNDAFRDIVEKVSSLRISS